MKFCNKWNLYCYEVFDEIDTESVESWVNGESCNGNCDCCDEMEEM